jgi:protoporphyrinogen oxidase
MGPLFGKMELKYAALLAGDFRDPELKELDRQSWREYLKQETPLSPGGQAFLGATLSLAAVWEWSMAAVLRDEINQMHPQEQGYTGVLCEIDGGLGRLPRELASLLPPGTIRFRTRVRDIRLDNADGGSLLLEDTATSTRRELGRR